MTPIGTGMSITVTIVVCTGMTITATIVSYMGVTIARTGVHNIINVASSITTQLADRRDLGQYVGSVGRVGGYLSSK